MTTKGVQIVVLLSAIGCGVAARATAEEKAQGFVLTKERAPFYAKAKDDLPLAYSSPGEVVTGFSALDHKAAISKTKTVRGGGWYGAEENGRIQVRGLAYVGPTREVRIIQGWFEKADLAPFPYDCGCGAAPDHCSPFLIQTQYPGRGTPKWNTCFEDGKNKKLAEMKRAAAPSGKRAPKQ